MVQTQTAATGLPLDALIAQAGEQWRYVLEGIDSLGEQGRSERLQKIRRILRDDGATYNDYSLANSSGRTWDLDLLPAIIPSDRWATIEAGLLERAELFNFLLRDIYGDNELLYSRIIPPEAIYAHRGFLRPCHGLKLQGEHELILHAVDMVQKSDGSFCVLTDRSQAPSGAGYALENRTVTSRVLPSLFRDSHVHRLSHFFQRLRSKLTRLMPQTEEPRIVILTPGAHNETYFEHAYLANYLGFSLVQSGDLAVRDGFVWMKSLDGLSRVDVILRRVDDWYCDPVELKSDSQLGVPGLLSVIRAGHVAVANPLGAGIIENPIFLKYIGAIGRRFLGRELRLPSVKTYWCGDAEDLKYVSSHLKDLVIKPVFRNGTEGSIIGPELSQNAAKSMLEKIRHQPQQYVAQEYIVPTAVPNLENNTFNLRPTILRGFSVANEQSSYSVMPGGLTRVGLNKGTAIISNQVGSTSKDTWVVASEPQKTSPSPFMNEQGHFRFARQTSLPSRVVENLFWLGRYAERAESTLRLLRTVFVALNSADTLPEECRRRLLIAVSDVTETHPGFKSASTEALASPDQELLSIILNSNKSGSVRSCIKALLNCAEESKEQLSSDTQRVINDIRDASECLEELLKAGLSSAPEEALDPLVTALMALAGLAQESMIRGVGWRFMEIGRRLERALQFITLSRSLLIEKSSDQEEEILVHFIFLTLEVLITSRRRYRGQIEIPQALELLIIDTSNPRSLLFQLEKLQDHIGELPHLGVETRELFPEQRAALEAITTLRLSRLVELSEINSENKRVELDQMLSRICHLVSEIGVVVSDKYFDHRVGPQQLVRAVWEGE